MTGRANIPCPHEGWRGRWHLLPPMAHRLWPRPLPLPPSSPSVLNEGDLRALQWVSGSPQGPQMRGDGYSGRASAGLQAMSIRAAFSGYTYWGSL